KDAAAKILGIGVATLYLRLKEMEEGGKQESGGAASPEREPAPKPGA
ncbi:MAG: helix-turn-helix domain-containing protein, partial [Planctomycetota bacterium]